MTTTELKQAMFDFAHAGEMEYEKLLAATPKESKTEIKALAIQKNMAGHAAFFCMEDFGGRYYEVRENIVFRFKHDDLFAEYYEEFCTLNEEDKKLFVTFAYPMLLVMRSFYLPRKELAEIETNAEKAFENRLIIGTVGEILAEWQRLWNKHGCMKCEVFK